MVVAVPRNILIDSVANTDAALMRKMDGAAEPLRLLRNYIDAFTDNPGLVQPDYGGLLASQIQDLVAIAVGATRDAAEIAHGRGIKAGRMRAIKSDIARNLTSGDVSATTLAARHKISRRYIHMLFEHEGTTLSRFVMAQRLAHVERALSDPRQLHLTIGAIAYNAGFNDLSSFNHAFRRRHGVTPREFRANLRQGLRSR
jgi:AraC-like DNA-binding protein